MTSTGSAARPQLIREMNEQLLLEQIRRDGQLSRADLARISSLSKPTVSLTLANLEKAGLVRVAGVRTGVPGPAAILYEVRPEAGFVLALDVGQQFLRGAVSDLAGARRATGTFEAHATDGHGRVVELSRLADKLLADAGVAAADITQTVVGSPGVYHPGRDALILAGALPGWDQPSVLTELRAAFGESLMIENDIDVAALAEQAHGHGRDVTSFAFVSVGTGIGMGLVLGGKLHRGAHGAAGEIGYLPLSRGTGSDPRDARRRGSLEAAASAAGIVRAARKAGMRGSVTARDVFAAAAEGDDRAIAVVAETALLVAQAICAVITVVDPELIVLGGGIGQAPGFCDALALQVKRLAPVVPEIRVSALGADAVVDGCIAAGTERGWQLVTASLPA
ncbi:ROK family protein [Acidothermaceae bacterium B102]|nr:ROK family protein [Acidothermaceae bacterium B102]